MATLPESPMSWKLKESVRLMRINANKGSNKSDSGQSQSLGPRFARSFGRSKDPQVKKQEIKVRHLRS